MSEEKAPNSPFFPSFVECAPSFAGAAGPKVFSHWSPRRTGIALIDAQIGRQHFENALVFAREICAPYFLVCVLKSMRATGIGPMEAAFLSGLVSKAVAGGQSAQMSDQEAYSLVILRGCDIATIRGVEAAARDCILRANQSGQPEALYAALMEWFSAPDTWVADVAALVVCGAAIKGAMH